MKATIHTSAILAAIILSACSGKKQTAENEVPDISVDSAFVDSVVVYNTYPGSLKAINTVDLVGRVDGYLRAQHFTDGQLVEKGAVLFTIEDSQYRDAVREAQASLATAQSSREYAASQYSAMKKALESDAVSVMEVNKAKSSLEQAEASIRTAQAQLQTAQTNLGYCTVRAPFRGHVSAANVDVGSYISGAGSPVTLATIYEDATLYAEFHINDKAMQEILLGDRRYKVNLDSIPFTFQQDVPLQYYGKLTYISPAVDTSTGTLSLRADVANRGGYLHDGMYVTIALPSKSDPKAILVKDNAIGTDQLGKYLFVVNDSNRVVYTPVHLGDIVRDSLRIVESGIEPGTRYVSKALLKVREGMTIHPITNK